MEELQNEEAVEETIEDRRWCVYMHTCKVNNKVYVGITSQNAERRWQKGFGYLNKRKDGTYTQPLMARAILKYSDWENDWYHIIFAENLSKDDARTVERLLIALYNTQNSNYGYNICPGGEISPMHGRRHSKESIAKMKESHPHLSGEKSPHYGKPHSEETKIKMSQARMGILNESLRVAICQYAVDGELINAFEYSGEASEKTGVSRSAIANCLCGLSKTAGGFIWKKSDEPITEEDILSVQKRKPVKNKEITDKYYKWYDKQKKRWKARFVHDGKSKHLGSFLTEEEVDEIIANHKNNFSNIIEER